MTTPGPGAEHVPLWIDFTSPNIARVYDYLLGGRDNYQADREQAAELVDLVPRVRELAQANRYFVLRAVRYLAGDVGIDQFIDIGSGLPSVDNVHQVAAEANPDARAVVAAGDLTPAGGRRDAADARRCGPPDRPHPGDSFMNCAASHNNSPSTGCCRGQGLGGGRTDPAPKDSVRRAFISVAAHPVQAHRIERNFTQLGQRFITCSCGYSTTGGAYDQIAERNHVCHVRTEQEVEQQDREQAA